MKNITESMNWRYATKKFDVNKKIDEETLELLLESLRLSPSSYGLQPWKFVLVSNKDIRKAIGEAGYNQPQITEASHLIIFTNKKNIDDKLVDEYTEFVSKESGIDASKLSGLSDMIKGSFTGKTQEDLRNWASRQVYLAAGALLANAAMVSVDACPMEGFDNSKVDEILKLSELGLESRLIIALGYRDEGDSSLKHKKIRFPKNEVFIELN